MTPWLPLLVVLLGGYLLGSIPFGLLLTRIAGLGDIRTIGSGNIGATNVLRTGNKLIAVLTLLLDGGKGAGAVLLTGLFTDSSVLPLVAGVAAFFGHLFPVWLKFQGGKGVATFLGILLALSLWLGLAAVVTWLIVAAVFRYSSLSALVAAALSPVSAWFLLDANATTAILVMTVLIFIRHKDNIARLRAGAESKIGSK